VVRTDRYGHAHAAVTRSDAFGRQTVIVRVKERAALVDTFTLFADTARFVIRIAADGNPLPAAYRAQRGAPLCGECYGVWAQYGDPDYPERACHACGRAWETSVRKPLCYNCYQRWTEW
jgi:hypothetical protein